MTNTKIAIYARHRNRSLLDEQIQRCRKLAVTAGLGAREIAVFSDSAGAGADGANREGFVALKAAIDARDIGVLLVDDFTALTRCAQTNRELLVLFSEGGVRVMTPHGCDSAPDFGGLLRCFTQAGARGAAVTSNPDHACLASSGFAREALRNVSDEQWLAVQKSNPVIGRDESQDGNFIKKGEQRLLYDEMAPEGAMRTSPRPAPAK